MIKINNLIDHSSTRNNSCPVVVVVVIIVVEEWAEKFISAVDDFFYQRDSSTATLMEEVCGLQGGLCWKNNPHLVNFHESILVDQWIFQLTTYIYIYIYIQTDCFLFSVARHTGCFKLGLNPAQLYVRLSILLLSHQAPYISSGITTHYVSVFACLHFVWLDTRVLNSLKELFIMRVAAINIYIYIYIYLSLLLLSNCADMIVSLTLFIHPQSFITPDRSKRLHLVSSQI